MKKIIVVAPHPDDETLGCGGVLLKHKNAGDEIHWLLMTSISAKEHVSAAEIERETTELDFVALKYRFDSVTSLKLPPALIDRFPLSELVSGISQVFLKIKPEVVYLPFEGDVHSDHRVTFQAAASCCKSFRCSSIKKIMSYETISETDFVLNTGAIRFVPNIFIPIEGLLEEKISIMNIYESEMGPFPFPRSESAIRALATIRGVNANCLAAESFMLLKEIDE